MKFHDLEQSWINFYTQIFKDAKSSMEIKKKNSDNLTTVRFICPDKYLGMFEELFPASENFFIKASLVCVPNKSCWRHIFDSVETIGGGRICGTGTMYIDIICFHTTEKYREPIDIVRDDLNVIDGKLIPLQFYWDNKKYFEDADVSFDVISHNQLKVHFPKKCGECAYCLKILEMHEKYICACRAIKEISPEDAACNDYRIIDHICLECSNYKGPPEFCTLEDCKYEKR